MNFVDPDGRLVVALAPLAIAGIAVVGIVVVVSPHTRPHVEQILNEGVNWLGNMVNAGREAVESLIDGVVNNREERKWIEELMRQGGLPITPGTYEDVRREIEDRKFHGGPNGHRGTLPREVIEEIIEDLVRLGGGGGGGGTSGGGPTG